MRRMDVLAIWYLFIFGGFVPYLTIKSARAVRAGAPVPPRKRVFLNTLVMELFFLGIAIFTARTGRIPLFQRGTLSGTALVAAVAIVGILLAAMPLLWKYTSEEQRRRAFISRPAETSELGHWLAVSLAAGFVEEIVYRGVMPALFLPMTGNWWTAVAICVVCFALGHANQGRWRTVLIGLIGLAMHWLVWLTGALYLAMATHFLYDFLAGLVYVRFARQMPSQPAREPAPAS